MRKLRNALVGVGIAALLPAAVQAVTTEVPRGLTPSPKGYTYIAPTADPPHSCAISIEYEGKPVQLIVSRDATSKAVTIGWFSNDFQRAKHATYDVEDEFDANIGFADAQGRYSQRSGTVRLIMAAQFGIIYQDKDEDGSLFRLLQDSRSLRVVVSGLRTVSMDLRLPDKMPGLMARLRTCSPQLLGR